MGLAIFKKSGSAYAINRQAQNVIPKDHNLHKYLVDQTGISFAYSQTLIDNKICVLESVSLGEATQPYVYRLCDSTGADKTYDNVQIDQISGIITLGDNYAGEAVYVKMVALYNQAGNSYPKGNRADTVARVTAIAEGQITPSTASIVNFVYNDLANSSVWQDGIDAAQHTMQLKALTVKYNGVDKQLNLDASDANNDLADLNLTVTAKVGNTSVIQGTPTFKEFVVKPNTGTSTRNINITLSGQYKGVNVNASNYLPQYGKELQSITYASGPTSANVGNTLNANSYSVNAVYSDSATPVTVEAQQIKLGSNGTWETSVNLNSTGTFDVYLKLGNKETANPVSLTVSESIVEYGDVTVNEDVKLLHPYNGSPVTTSFVLPENNDSDFTIQAPTYSQQYGSTSITSGATITYTFNGATVTSPITPSDNTSSKNKDINLVANITLNGKIAQSTTVIRQGVTAAKLLADGFVKLNYAGGAPQSISATDGYIWSDSGKHWKVVKQESDANDWDWKNYNYIRIASMHESLGGKLTGILACTGDSYPTSDANATELGSVVSKCDDTGPGRISTLELTQGIKGKDSLFIASRTDADIYYKLVNQVEDSGENPNSGTPQ